MAKATPHVESMILLDQDAHTIVGSPAWYTWLEHAMSFSFANEHGSFSARKELRGQSGWYWKAYRKHKGKLHRAYLGKSKDLSPDRLNAVAAELTESVRGSPPAGSAIVSSPEPDPLTKTAHDSGTDQAAPPLQAFSLLATKLYIPPPRSQLVSRPQLLARLDEGLTSKLTLLSAPAGFGKTTLLSSWRATAAGSRLPFAWVSLDAADSDPLRFWSYVLTALDTLHPNSGATALALLQSPASPSIEVVLTPVLNALNSLSTDAVLVLDDYHLIDTPGIHSAVAFLLEHLPPRFHLVILTRADPPLPLTRLRARGQLTELRAADFRFSAEETAAFLTELMGLPLSADDILVLETRTEGWIAGLQLAALAMRHRNDLPGFIQTFSGSNRFVVDYLVEEVLGRLPAHLQTFLLKTSILDRLCASLCDTVLLGGEETADPSAPAYSQLVLEQLERTNLFVVPLDDERRWYRYHHLFAEVLRARLKSGATAAELATLHQRASLWYERQGLIGEAVHFAFQVDDIKRATALIEQHGLRVMLDQNEVFQVQTWVERLPRELIIARPRLTIIAGFIVGFWLQLDAVERLLEEAAPAFDSPELDPNSVGELLALRSTLARVRLDVAATLALAQQALGHLDSTNYALLAVVNLNIGMVLLERNEIAAANQAFSEALAISEREGEWIGLATFEKIMRSQFRQGQIRQMLATSEALIKRSARRGQQRIPASGIGYVGLAEVLYEWNHLAEAMQAAAQALELLRRGVERLLLVRAYVILARIHQASGHQIEALAALRQCEEWFAHNRIPVLKTLTLIFAYHLGPLVGYERPAAPQQTVPQHGSLDELEASYVERLILARQWLMQGESNREAQLLAEACTTLEQLLPEVEARGWGQYQIKALLLLGLAYQKRQDRVRAQASLERALILAEPDGYVRTFVDEGAPMAALLGQVARAHSPAAPYAARLLAAFPKLADEEAHAHSQELIPSGRSVHSPALAEPLSSREIEILRLIGDGLSNQAIADRLIIAVSTVKRHINNIYGKLAVQSRTQALLRARELELL